MKISTSELCKKLNLKRKSIHDYLCKDGHAKGWTPAGYVEGSKEYIWELRRVRK